MGSPSIVVFALTVSWASLPPWLTSLLAACALLISLLCLIVVWRVSARVRGESRSAADLARRATDYVQSFDQTLASKVHEAVAPLETRLVEAQREADGVKAEVGSLAGTIAEAQKGLDRVIQRFEQFEEYFRSVFEKELRFAFRSFDETMGGVLKEMKGELLRGISRIDQIQSVVNSRSHAETQLVASEQQTARLLKSGPEGAAKPSPATAQGASGDGMEKPTGNPP